MEEPLPEDNSPELEEDIASEREAKPSRPEYTVLNGIQTVLSIALVMATLLTLWNPRKVFKTTDLAELVEVSATESAIEEVAKEESKPIGILAGHWQDQAPGEVCADGTIESDVNYDIASRVAQKLEKLGYRVDLFPEFDMNLLNYEGAVLIAIYSGSCSDDPKPASGFKVGASLNISNPDLIDQLATCMSREYQNATNLPFTYEIIEEENAAYHIFRDINSSTPAVLLEMGSLNTDRRVLVNQADHTAEGIVAGIQCFLENQGVSE